MGETETRIYVTMLLVASRLKDGATEFDNLLKHAQHLLSEPWRRRSIEEEDVKRILGAKYSADVKNAVLLGSRIAPVLARGTSGNPRQVKRFINALNLRLKVSEARGFGSKIDAQILAKIMLAERYLPQHVFNHFAQASATAKDGISIDLQQAEQRARAVNEPTAETEAAKDDVAPNQIIVEWFSRPDVVRWLKLEPQLGKIDLQPYLFVINDLKSFLGADDLLSPKLLNVLEKLCGGDVAVKSVKAALGNLDASEVSALFKELRSRVLSEKDWSQRPNSLAGLAELVIVHGQYDLQYVEVLAELPIRKLGVWAAVGHEKVVKSEAAKSRLGELKGTWKQRGGHGLKAALDINRNDAKRS